MSLMAEGTYATIISGAKTVVSNGKEVMVLEFRPTHVFTDDWAACEAAPSRSLWMYLTDAAIPHTDKKLVALGFNGDFENPSFTETRPNMVCRHETYNGTVRDKWELAEWGDGVGETIDTATSLKLRAGWDARHNKPAVPSGAPAAPPASSSGPPSGDAIPY